MKNSSKYKRSNLELKSGFFNFSYEKILTAVKITGAFFSLLKYTAIVTILKSMIQVCVFFKTVSKKMRSALWRESFQNAYYNFMFVAEVLIGENGEKMILEKIEKQKSDFLHRRNSVEK